MPIFKTEALTYSCHLQRTEVSTMIKINRKYPSRFKYSNHNWGSLKSSWLSTWRSFLSLIQEKISRKWSFILFNPPTKSNYKTRNISRVSAWCEPCLMSKESRLPKIQTRPAKWYAKTSTDNFWACISLPRRQNWQLYSLKQF